jgi:glutathione S-transferase
MACIEKGIEHELVPIARGSAEHRALHPFLRMPVLEHDGLVVTESLAITGYIDEAFDGPALQPTDLAGRTLLREWQSICADYLFRDVVRGIPRDRAPSEQELSGARTALEQADTRVGDSEFLLGEQLTLADLYLAPQVSNAREKAPELLDSLAGIGRWLDSIAARASFLETSYEPPS